MTASARHLLLALSLAACADRPGPQQAAMVVRDSAGFRIVENAFDTAGSRIVVDTTPTFRLGSGAADDAPLFGHVTAMHVLASGTIAILDLTESELLFVDSAGTVLGRAAGKGSGPGEFPGGFGPAMVQTFAGRGDSLYAVINRADVAVFVPSHVVRTSKLEPLPGGGFSAPLAVVGAALITANRLQRNPPAPGVYADSGRLERHPLDGSAGDTLDAVPLVETRYHPMGAYPAPFGRRLQVASKQDWLVTGFPEQFKVAWRGADGRITQIARVSKPAVPMTAEIVERHKARVFENFGGSPEERAAMEADLSLDQLPKVLPAFAEVKVDGAGRAWLREYTDLDGLGPMNADMGKGPRWRSDKPVRWYVLGTDGAFLGEVQLPAGFVLHDIAKDKIVGVVRDADDVEYVVGYRFRAGR